MAQSPLDFGRNRSVSAGSVETRSIHDPTATVRDLASRDDQAHPRPPRRRGRGAGGVRGVRGAGDVERAVAILLDAEQPFANAGVAPTHYCANCGGSGSVVNLVGVAWLPHGDKVKAT